jgi:MFS family permease
MLLWWGQSLSGLGSAVTIVVVPLVAVSITGAGPFEVGLLGAAGSLPYLLFALPAGLVVDRASKRLVMLACDAVRMLLIGSLPLAALFGAITQWQLYVVAFVCGSAAVFFDIAYQSYLPSLVAGRHLADGNAKLATTDSLSKVAGPGVGGVLFGAVRAGSLFVDALSYLVSTLTLLVIRTRGRTAPPATIAPGERPRLRVELLAGAAFVLKHPVMNRTAACSATINLFGAMLGAVQIIFLVRVLHVPPYGAGLVGSAAGAGGILGGAMSGRLTRWMGAERVVWVSVLGFGALTLLVPLAGPGWRLVFAAVGLAADGFFCLVYSVAQLSYRQRVCPPDLLGRVNAALRWVSWGLPFAGALLGGAMGVVLGIRTTVWLSIIGEWSAGWWVFFSPLRTASRAPGKPVAEPSRASRILPTLGRIARFVPVGYDQDTKAEAIRLVREHADDYCRPSAMVKTSEHAEGRR